MNTNVQGREGNLWASQNAAIADRSRTGTDIGINSILESTLILSWPDVMQQYPSGLLHLEYRTGSDDFIEYLKIWSSGIRGRWQLVCEYWAAALWSHAVGLRFSEGYSSSTMAEMLEFVMEHQDAFLRTPAPTHDVMLQVYPPTAQETAAAEQCTQEAVRRIGGRPGIGPFYSAQRERLRREAELLHSKSAEEIIAQEAATNEGMAEQSEART